mmetsp:Transcript_43448/g.82910  ORF Transcript_43448/g.82910 Transcript_43448/m.82910 type:complete len:586 (-) Transcript_43448:188-1945(-)
MRGDSRHSAQKLSAQCRSNSPSRLMDEFHEQATCTDGKDLVHEVGWASSEIQVLGLLLAFRLTNSVVVCTYFNADEYWQSLEVAHRLVFGYGHLTWEWQSALRTYVHPLIFACIYFCLKITGLDTPATLALAPRLLQGACAALTDFYMYKLASRMFGPTVGAWALFCQVTCWFHFFCSVRTFSNCMESTLTMAALAMWPSLPSRHTSQGGGPAALALALAAASVVMRPTALILWTPLVLREMFISQSPGRWVWQQALPVGCAVFGLAAAVDSAAYGRWVFVPWNFFVFNVLRGGAAHYGSHPWHWYLSQGIPSVTLTLLPLVLVGIWQANSHGQRLFAWLAAWFVAVHSFIPHKEFRFLLPVLPLLLMYAGRALATVQPAWTNHSAPGAGWQRRFWNRRALLLGILITQVPAALYLSVVHQRGSLAVMPFLASEAENGRVRGGGILFLTPCHATPFSTHIHRPVPMRFLDCTPPAQAGDMDESDVFFSNPASFLESSYFAKDQDMLPSHIVVNDDPQVLGSVQTLLVENNYKLVNTFFNAHFAVDRALQANVLVFSSAGTASSTSDAEVLGVQTAEARIETLDDL